MKFDTKISSKTACDCLIGSLFRFYFMLETISERASLNMALLDLGMGTKGCVWFFIFYVGTKMVGFSTLWAILEHVLQLGLDNVDITGFKSGGRLLSLNAGPWRS